ncbi:ABC transporter substrate-binding protein [Paenibacillus sp. L3-i20]|uniref:ABC transporter substrate-binding protein n=1 Tax=Paenibacillus sp. L3-i20 TaxID=2905833 RepID=UPI001EDD688E|nr:extracellular solute-binding protein [Paenibacillus sp. L3-i20]GKU77355.1 hypothetical protein L3i20_v217520 [Paenibacillus sp. L3-i20]
MKQSIVVLMVIVMVIVTACSNSSNGNGGPDTPTEGKENTSAGTDGSGTTPAKDGSDGKQNNTEKKTIVVSTFVQERFLLAAKKKYEEKYPHITIDVDYVEFTDANGEAMREKYRKTIGTAMLSGKGPDLLEMDQLPTENYVNKKLLANLGDMMDKDDTFHKDDYFTNIFEGIKVNGGIYGMPMKVFLYGLKGNETIIENSNVKVDDKNWDWSQFANVTKEISKTVDGGTSGLFVNINSADFKISEFVSQFVNDQYATFVDQESGKANFESPAFIDLLKEVKRLVDEKVIDREAKKYIFSNTIIMSPPDYVIEMKQSQFIEDKYKFKSKLYLKPNGSGKEAGGQFRTFQTIGINAKSKVKEEAWHFLKFLMSEELTNEVNGWGFPINKKSYALAAEKILKEGKVESPQPIGPLKGVIYDITQEDIDELEKMLNNAKYPVQFKESKINEIITEESYAYLTGQKSPEEVAKLIQNRVTTVLNE